MPLYHNALLRRRSVIGSMWVRLPPGVLNLEMSRKKRIFGHEIHNRKNEESVNLS